MAVTEKNCKRTDSSSMGRLGSEPDCVVLRDPVARVWLVFRNPRCLALTRRADDLIEKLRWVESAVHEHGCHAAGFVSYDAAPGCDPAFRVRKGDLPDAFPLLWFGLYDQVEMVDKLDPVHAETSSLEWTPSISRSAYEQDLCIIRERLRLGETYQVNYSFRLRAPFASDPWAFFRSLAGGSPPPHAAYVSLDGFSLCSFSPELFFSLDGNAIQSKPMKGTRPRGATLAEDRRLAGQLRCSAKDLAENVMIVDMVRNDLGRIAAPGSVRPLELFTVEKHPTVWQMTSTVAAQTDRPLADIFQALFPPASVTGAPKTATMGIIADLETTPRRIYTGCIGHISPDRKASFNVAIRTALVDRRRKEALYGVGGGIVWDSDARNEYEECRVKARILSRKAPHFELLETMLWKPKLGCALLEEHLARLAASAEYFDYPCDLSDVRFALGERAASLPDRPRVIRLLLDRRGQVRLEDRPPPDPPSALPRVALAADPVDSRDPFLYHKTTHRAVYEQALAQRPGFDDVLLYNERGEVTESTRANVAIMLEGALYTPPVSCGLLAGTMRQTMLDQGRVRERILSPADLTRAQQVLLVNSVRGVQVVECVWNAGGSN